MLMLQFNHWSQSKYVPLSVLGTVLSSNFHPHAFKNVYYRRYMSYTVSVCRRIHKTKPNFFNFQEL